MIKVVPPGERDAVRGVGTLDLDGIVGLLAEAQATSAIRTQLEAAQKKNNELEATIQNLKAELRPLRQKMSSYDTLEKSLEHVKERLATQEKRLTEELSAKAEQEKKDLLSISGKFAFDYKCIQFQLPNLKKLCLINLSNVPDWVWSLYTFAPFLQDSTLVFETTAKLPPNVISPLNLHFLDLKSLALALIPGIIQVSIDAPKLTHLIINGCVLPYTFRRIPTELIKACIELRREEEEEEDENDAEDFHWVSEFFRGMSSITNFEIVVFRSINIFSFLNLNPPMFFNVVRLEVTLNGSDFSGWNDLLVSLQCFPNLQHLCVTFDVMGFVDELVQTMWRSPDIVPSCLVNKLEMIKIIGLPLSGIAAGLMLLRYILRNAKVLRKLYFGAWFDEHSQAQELWKERKFCKSLFKLPRSSPTSKVVFSGRFITSSSNTFKKGKLTCKMT
ncbi:uncharacterized protein LOC110739908 [Chenopodium quinoa]|uniref:uncharacterized protein LOC110739908 n=1 Tax=Chenopodium quinoa TaxID=63459 RepID=UPI000B78D9F0|nr:uncharacterized protein LOC110739908 [Chenopodium quinoa]